MDIERIQCIECDRMILPATAAANGGLCGPCSKVPKDLRQQQRAFEALLTSGAWFTPSHEERRTAMLTGELAGAVTAWVVEPDFYGERGITSVSEALALGASQAQGCVFLTSAQGARLN